MNLIVFVLEAHITMISLTLSAGWKPVPHSLIGRAYPGS